MKEHLRFGGVLADVSRPRCPYPFGVESALRPWNNGASPMEAAEKRLAAAFELFTKLKRSDYCFHDRVSRLKGRRLPENESEPVDHAQTRA